MRKGLTYVSSRAPPAAASSRSARQSGYCDSSSSQFHHTRSIPMLVFLAPPQSCSHSPASGTSASLSFATTSRTRLDPPVMPKMTPPAYTHSGSGPIRPLYSVYASTVSGTFLAPIICPVSLFVGVVDRMEIFSSSIKSNSA